MLIEGREAYKSPMDSICGWKGAITRNLVIKTKQNSLAGLIIVLESSKIVVPLDEPNAGSLYWGKLWMKAPDERKGGYKTGVTCG